MTWRFWARGEFAGRTRLGKIRKIEGEYRLGINSRTWSRLKSIRRDGWEKIFSGMRDIGGMENANRSIAYFTSKKLDRLIEFSKRVEEAVNL